MEDKIVMVDEEDNEIGFIDKSKAHVGKGVLHRAFSIIVRNENGEMLIQKRNKSKPLWGLYWSNTCCSHQRKGERLQESTHRRLEEEFGFNCELREIFTFRYHAQFMDRGCENELDHVFVGIHNGEAHPNPDEIIEHKWIHTAQLLMDMNENPGNYTPWFHEIAAKMKRHRFL